MGRLGQHLLGGVLLCLLVSGAPDAASGQQDADSSNVRWAANSENAAMATPRPSSQRQGSPNKPGTTSFFDRAMNPPENPKLLRLATWGGLSITEAIMAYQKTVAIWGKPSGRFHFKEDLKGDHMALSDEASHLFLSYKLAQIVRQGYRWSGLSPSAAARAGAIQAALYMTFVEFPLDAYNPKQGFGISDFVANLAGIGLAWYRAGVDNPRWDLKASVKRQFFEGNRRLLAHTNKQYDDYIYWLTYRISDDRYNPLVLGVGYSTHHPRGGTVDKELHFSIGTSFSEIGRIFGRRTERIFSPAGFYFLSAGALVNWK